MVDIQNREVVAGFYDTVLISLSVTLNDGIERLSVLFLDDVEEYMVELFRAFPCGPRSGVLLIKIPLHKLVGFYLNGIIQGIEVLCALKRRPILEAIVIKPWHERILGIRENRFWFLRLFLFGPVVLLGRLDLNGAVAVGAYGYFAPVALKVAVIVVVEAVPLEVFGELSAERTWETV